MRPVLTKRDFIQRYARGEFGNASPTWNTIEEFESAHYRAGLVHIRNRITAGPTWYDVPWQEVRGRWSELVKQGVPPSSLYLSAMAPTKETLFQGEVMRGLWGLELTYTTIAKPMRAALRQRTQRTCGIMAVCLLRRFLCPNSHDWLMHLLDAYPDHVVEFSTYSVEWGTVPGFNTVFWEVRRY